MGASIDLSSGLRAMAADAMLPGGRRKLLTRLVRDHLSWFAMAERRGLTWRDMAAALASVDILSASGKVVTVGALSSAVWRARSEAEKSRQRISPKDAGLSGVPDHRSQAADHRPARKLTDHKPRGSTKEAEPATSDTLRFMKRARRLRQPDD